METKYTQKIVAEKLEEFKRRQENRSGISERELAKQIDIPRSTLRHWQERRGKIEEDINVVAFFTSPSGVECLHRFTVAIHFVTSFLGTGGVRLVSTFLELSGLSKFIASSYGTQRKTSKEMGKAICAFEKQEEKRLGAEMESRKICIAEDETYHEKPCLVAIEPVSGYILLEEYAEDRQAETWNERLSEAIENKPIEIIQSTSDEGRGIISHVKNGIGAHHAPDVFHVQQEVSRAVSGSLAGKVRQAETDVKASEQEVRKQEKKKEVYHSKKHGRGRPPSFDKRIETAKEQADEAFANLADVVETQEQAGKARRAVSQVYHPYNIETGNAQNAKEVDDKLNKAFEKLEAIAEKMHLRDSTQKRIAKAKRVVVEMTATIAFYWLVVHAKIEALELSEDVELVVMENLLPAYYLFTTAEKKKDADQRRQIQEKAEELIAIVHHEHSPIQQLSAEEKQIIDAVAWECVNVFQPSSSCVEGRNGQLALRHHALHRISDQKLNALKVVHNFHLRRIDGTTAAERFFGREARDLFSYLLNSMNLSGFPAKKRPYVKQKISLFTPENHCLA